MRFLPVRRPKSGLSARVSEGRWQHRRPDERCLPGLLLLAALTVPLASCEGSIDGVSQGGNGSGSGTGSDGRGPRFPTGGSNTPASTDPKAAGAYPLRLLTRLEYDNSILDIFGDDGHPAADFPSEISGTSGFATVGDIHDVNVNAYMHAAESLAARVAPRLEELVPCAGEADPDDKCMEEVIRTVGRRLFRRSLTATDVQDYASLYVDQAKGAWGYGFQQGAKLVVQALLQSPYFLYRWELDTAAPQKDGEWVRLSGYQVASRLSHFFWASTPDEKLLAAAEKGELSTPAQVETQARRLLVDEKAKRTLESFHSQWLGLGGLASMVKNPVLYPSFDDSLKQAMAQEVTAFTNSVLVSGDGRLATLLSAPYAYVNETLAELYDIDGVSGPEFRKVNVDPTQRSGLLTIPAVLAANADANEGNPILRGKLVREHFLCETLIAPPPGIPTLSSLDQNKTMRERLDAHAKQEPCRGCHLKTDPIGYTFENYDAIGRYRTLDHGKPVDASGMVYGLDGQDVPVNGAPELADALVASEQFRACVTTQWLRYALGRGESGLDTPSLEASYELFSAADYDIRELLVALARSRTFTHRTAVAGDESL